MRAAHASTWIAMLFLSALTPLVVNSQVLNISGVWEHESVDELFGRDYTVLYRYIVFQKKQKVCGCLYRSGIGSDRIDQSSFRGIAHSNHADIWLDSGSASDINYVPKFPFQHDEIVRLRLYGKKLVMGIIQGDSKSLSRLNSEKDIYYDMSHRLARVRSPARAGTCDTVSDDNFMPFLAQCLNDKNMNE